MIIPRLSHLSTFCCALLLCVIFKLTFVRHFVCTRWILHEAAVNVNHFQFHRFELPISLFCTGLELIDVFLANQNEEIVACILLPLLQGKRYDINDHLEMSLVENKL